MGGTYNTHGVMIEMMFYLEKIAWKENMWETSLVFVCLFVVYLTTRAATQAVQSRGIPLVGKIMINCIFSK
jgi:hypothetical protein